MAIAATVAGRIDGGARRGARGAAKARRRRESKRIAIVKATGETGNEEEESVTSSAVVSRARDAGRRVLDRSTREARANEDEAISAELADAAKKAAFISSKIASLLAAKDESEAEATVKALTAKTAKETTSLLEDLKKYKDGEFDAEANSSWEEYERTRERALRQGVAYSAVTGIAVTAVLSTVSIDAVLSSLESNPPLAALEQLVGFVVTAYYGTVYRRLLTTTEGRQALRLDFAEAFSQISGAPELAAKLAASSDELDAAVCKTIADMEEQTPRNKIPASVLAAIDVYYKARDTEKAAMKNAVFLREQEEIRAVQAREAKAKAAELDRLKRKREQEETRERQQREREAKAKALVEKREREQRERDLKAQASQREREAKAKAAQEERERQQREAKAKAKAAQEERAAQIKAAQEERAAQIKAAQEERAAKAKAAQEERAAKAKAAQEEREAKAKAAQEEREREQAKIEAQATETKEEPTQPESSPEIPSIETSVGMPVAAWIENINVFMSKRTTSASSETDVDEALQSLETAKAELGKQMAVEFSLTQKLEAEQLKVKEMEEELQVLVAKSMTSASQSDEKARNLGERVRNLEDELKASNARNDELSEECREVTSRLEKVQLEYTYQRTQVERKTDARVSELEGVSGMTVDEVAKLKDRVRSEEIAKDEAIARVKQLKAKVSELERAVSELRTANKALERDDMRAGALEGRVKALMTENAELKTQVSDLTRMLREAERAAEIVERDAAFELRKVTLAADQRRRELEHQYANEERRIKNLEADAKKAIENSARLEKQFATLLDEDKTARELYDAKREAEVAMEDAATARAALAKVEAKLETRSANEQSYATLEMSRALDAASAETKQAQAQLQEMRDSVAQMERSLNESSRAEKEQMKSEIERLRAEKESALETLKSAEARAESQALELRQALARVQEEKAAAQSRLDGEQNARLSDMAKLQETVARLTEEKSAFERELANAVDSTALDASRAECETLRGQLQAKTDELNKAEKAASESARTYASEISSLKSASSAEKDAINAAAANEALRRQGEIDRLVEERNDVRNALAELEAKAAENAVASEKERERIAEALRVSEAKLATAVDSSEARIAEIRAKYDELVAEKSEVDRAYAESKKSIDDAMSQSEQNVAAARTAVAQVEERFTALEVEIKRLRAEKSRVDARLVEETSKSDGLVSDIERLVEEGSARELSAASAAEAFESLKGQLTDAERRASEANARFEALKAKTASLVEASELEAARDDARRAENAWREKLRIAELEQEELRDEIERTRAEASEATRLRSMSDELERKLAEADDRASELARELRSEQEAAAAALAAIAAERDELTRNLTEARAKVEASSSALNDDVERELRADLARMEARLAAAEDDADVARERAQEEFAVEAQTIAERAASDLAEAESRFATQLEELEAKLSSATLAIKEAEAKTEALAKRAAKAETAAERASGAQVPAPSTPTPVIVSTETSSPGVDAASEERPAIVFEPSSLTALSKMKRDELIAECAARGLDATGLAAELRSRLRDARLTEKNALTQQQRAQKRKAPQGFYRTVGGVRYDNAALCLADTFMAERGEIDRAGAEKIYESVFDGAGITKIELETLALVLAGGGGRYAYVLSDAAATYLQPRIDARREEIESGLTKSASKQYRVIDGAKYDDKALSIADASVKKSGAVSLAAAERVFDAVLDGAGATAREIATLVYIAESMPPASDDVTAYLTLKINELRAR
jgi:chromosome segregation ATPase